MRQISTLNWPTTPRDQRAASWKAPLHLATILIGLLALAGCMNDTGARELPVTGTSGEAAEPFPRSTGATVQDDPPQRDPGNETSPPPESICGDLSCAEGETTKSCPGDCGSECGDGVCNGEELSGGCPADCSAQDDAVVVEANFPDSLGSGAEGSATVVMRNTGTATWTWADGYKLGAVDDEDPFKIGDVRVWLEEEDTVAPGEEHTFEIPMKASDEAGTFTSDWQMVHEGVTWFGETATAEITVEDIYPLPLPNMYATVQAVAEANPELLANSCQDEGGTWEFLDLLVDTLRLTDDRWGYNWKRGVVGDPSQDVVDYHYGPGEREGSEEVYIIDVIVAHCSPDPSPGWGDQTQATLDKGEIGKWTGRGRF